MTNEMTDSVANNIAAARLEQAMSLHTRLASLRDQHQQINDTISSLRQNAYGDELVLHRLKKQKLMVRDRIHLIERMLEPATRA